MIRRESLEHIINFLVYVVLQLFLINKLVLFNQAFCFFYVGFLLYLPQSLGRVYQLFIGMGIGLLVDVFFDTPGIHAAASVFLMFLRPGWLNVTTGGSLEEGEKINLRNLGLTSFVTFSLPLIAIHHITIFTIEGYGFSSFYDVFLKILFSSMFTLMVVTIIQLLLAPAKSRR